ncbi:hypothetical protein DLAC_00153 [Tieghemostelium lacteum]|uniref:EGF-like domain-containing protein n=1 Tax=Tieghemostelium lacteum TaxID=361077 RepID=A0A152A901_TIELA|nr:hypothetical protein DLAC_00153 [Tieghemostelium lacteum]|eukprot:KYR02694.1 hypothetical protein DLAC_00153 [Tieghemostelium lacteum]
MMMTAHHRSIVILLLLFFTIIFNISYAQLINPQKITYGGTTQPSSIIGACLGNSGLVINFGGNVYVYPNNQLAKLTSGDYTLITSNTYNYNVNGTMTLKKNIICNPTSNEFYFLVSQDLNKVYKQQATGILYGTLSASYTVSPQLQIFYNNNIYTLSVQPNIMMALTSSLQPQTSVQYPSTYTTTAFDGQATAQDATNGVVFTTYYDQVIGFILNSGTVMTATGSGVGAISYIGKGFVDVVNKKLYFLAQGAGGTFSAVVFEYTLTGTLTTLASLPVSTFNYAPKGLTVDVTQGQIIVYAQSQVDQRYCVFTSSNRLINTLQYSPLTSDTQNSFVEMSIVSGGLLIVGATETYFSQYHTVCPSDCLGFGQCVNSSCQCVPGRSGADCSDSYPELSGFKAVPYSTVLQTVTIIGQYFWLPLTVTINQIPCTSPSVNQLNTQIYCNISLSNFNPDTNYEIKVQNGGQTNLNSYPVFLSQSFSSLVVSGTKLTLSYQNLYPWNSLTFKLSNTEISCSLVSTSIECTVPSPVKSGSLIVYNTFTSVTQVVNGVVLKPIISLINNGSTIPAGSYNITIQGYYFKSNTFSPVFIKDDGIQTAFAGQFTDSELVYTKTVGITSNRLLSLIIGSYETNQVAYTFTPPSISTTSFSPSDFVLTIVGNNFGNKVNLVSVSSGDSLVWIVNSVTNTVIKVQVPRDVKKSILTITIGGQAVTTSLNFQPNITNIITPPSIDGDGIEFTGLFLDETVISIQRDSNPGTSIPLQNCVYLFQNPHWQVGCDFPSGTGYFNLTSTSTIGTATTLNTTYRTSYDGVDVDYVEPSVYYIDEPTNITIGGYNFADVDLLVTVNGNNCVIVNITISQVVCTIFQTTPPQSDNPVIIRISVDGVVSEDKSNLYYRKKCTINCLNGGTCDYVTGGCQCTSGFKGQDCSEIDNQSSHSSIEISSSNIFHQNSQSIYLFIIISIIIILLN